MHSFHHAFGTEEQIQDDDGRPAFDPRDLEFEDVPNDIIFNAAAEESEEVKISASVTALSVLNYDYSIGLNDDLDALRETDAGSLDAAACSGDGEVSMEQHLQFGRRHTSVFVESFENIITQIRDYQGNNLEFVLVPLPSEEKYPSIAVHARRWSLNDEQFVPFSLFVLSCFTVSWEATFVVVTRPD